MLSLFWLAAAYVTLGATLLAWKTISNRSTRRAFGLPVFEFGELIVLLLWPAFLFQDALERLAQRAASKRPALEIPSVGQPIDTRTSTPESSEFAVVKEENVSCNTIEDRYRSGIVECECAGCGKLHSARLSGGVSERMIACYCGALVRISRPAIWDEIDEKRQQEEEERRATIRVYEEKRAQQEEEEEIAFVNGHRPGMVLAWVLLWQGRREDLRTAQAQSIIAEVVLPNTPELRTAPAPTVIAASNVPDNVDIYVAGVMMATLTNQGIDFNPDVDQIFLRRWTNPYDGDTWAAVWAVKGTSGH